MADNITLNAGSGGAVIATDDDGTAHHQYVKLEFGADNTQTKVTSAVGLPVSDAGGSLTVDGTVAVSGTVTVDGSGVTQPVSLASVPSHAVTNAGTFATQAAQSGTWNVTNVSGTVSLPTGAATAANQTTVIGHLDGVEGILTTIDADTGNVSTKIDTLAGAVAGTEMQVDVVAALPAGTNAIGKLAANSGVDIGDVDILSIAAGDNNIGNVDIVTMPTVTVNAHAVTNAGTFAVQVDGNALTALQLIDDGVATTGSAITAKGMTACGTDGTNARALKTDTSGELQVDVLTMPTTAVSQSGTWTVQPGNTQNTTAWLTTPVPATSGGLSIFRTLDLDETEEEVKATAGQVYGCWFTNTATATRWLKFYNATAANVTVGTTTPVITLGLPGNTSDDIAGVLMGGAHGIAFGTAITVAVTTGVADNDTGAPGANDVILNVFYK